MADRPRIIVALPARAEGTAVADWLSADGFEPVWRPTPQTATSEMQARAFDLLIADVALAARCELHADGRARRGLTPTILIGDGNAAPHGSRATCLARPVDRALLACYVSMALLDGRPARRSVRKTIDRFEAMVNGVPSYIVDVSAEGLRLEVARHRGAALPPYFTVRVPLVGIGVTVRRMWTCASSNPAVTQWYGAALAQNRSSAEQAWRSFVDTIPVVHESGLRLNP